jgi:hypothetical protein
MSDTPETDSNCWREGTSEWVAANLARKLERERDQVREDLDEEMKFHHRTHRECVMAQCELMDVKNERDEALAQMCQAVGHLSTIAEDCEAWLNSESDEPSVDFIKAVRDYAKKGIDA